MDKLTRDYKDYLYERLQDPDAVAEYLNAVLEEGDVPAFLLAVRIVAEARGFSSVAKAAELNRESLYRMLSDQGNPRLSSMVSLFEALGVQLQVRPARRDTSCVMTTVKPVFVEDESESELTVVAQLSTEEHEHEYGNARPSEFKPAAA
jgi:probable addiction module antidote protein